MRDKERDRERERQSGRKTQWGAKGVKTLLGFKCKLIRTGTGMGMGMEMCTARRSSRRKKKERAQEKEVRERESEREERQTSPELFCPRSLHGQTDNRRGRDKRDQVVRESFAMAKCISRRSPCCCSCCCPILYKRNRHATTTQ